MRLLIFTQTIDQNDPILGFFHGWITELASTVDSITVICLNKKEFDLPSNVSVYSLGKERGVTKLGYVYNLYRYLFLIRGSYDKVFVHMNQEYVLLAGLYWKLLKIPVYLWRNHPQGGILTRCAVALSTKVFCTSPKSFTARFKKSVIMPVGTDTKVCRVTEGVIRKKYSVCMVGRLSPIKHIELALAAVHHLITAGTQISLVIVGSPGKNDREYVEFLRNLVTDLNLSAYVHFVDAVSPDKVCETYSSHEVCLNLTESGSFDKTIVEAAACGSIPLTSNSSLEGFLPEGCITGTTPEAIGASIQRLLDPKQRVEIQEKLTHFVASQSLAVLMEKLKTEIEI